MQNPLQWESLPEAEKKVIIDKVHHINSTLMSCKNFEFEHLEKFWELIFKLAKNWQPEDKEHKKKIDKEFKTYFEKIS